MFFWRKRGRQHARRDNLDVHDWSRLLMFVFVSSPCLMKTCRVVAGARCLSNGARCFHTRQALQPLVLAVLNKPARLAVSCGRGGGGWAVVCVRHVFVVIFNESAGVEGVHLYRKERAKVHLGRGRTCIYSRWRESCTGGSWRVAVM